MKHALTLMVAFFTLSLVAHADDKAAAETKTEKKMEEKAAAKTEKADAKEGEEKAAASADAVTCKSGSDVRTLTIKKGEGFACQLMYKKGSDEKSVAEAKNDANFCNGKLEKMKTTLTGAGFTCE